MRGFLLVFVLIVIKLKSGIYASAKAPRYFFDFSKFLLVD